MTTTTCPDCGDQTHHIEIPSDCISYDPENGWVLHLTDEELQGFRAELGSYL